MTMKKTVLILLALALCAALAGCRGNGPLSPTPSPDPLPQSTLEPSDNPLPQNTLEPSTNPLPQNTLEPGISTETADPNSAINSGIEGFEEGKAVDIKDVPDVEKAIMDKYPGAKIKSVMHALHLDEQVYRVVLEAVQDGSTDFYVTTDGHITPYSPAGDN